MNKVLLIGVLLTAGSAGLWACARVWGWSHVVVWAIQSAVVVAAVMYVAMWRKRNA